MRVSDTLGRPVRNLRISLSDRCNFRCTYCMPEEIFHREYEFVAGGVLDGIAAAAEAGLTLIKINMLVKRGVNNGSILDMAGHFNGSSQTAGLHKVEMSYLGG